MKGARIMAKSKSTGTATVTPKEDNVVVKYFKETRAELRKVSWPTREETQNLTMIIVGVTVAMALFLGLLDYLFQIVTAGVIGGDIIRIIIAVLLLAAGVAAFYYNSQQE
jgi:preprotein translocase subunit SecE